MFFARSGMNITNACRLILLPGLLAGLVTGCSKTETEKKPASSIATKQEPTNGKLVLRSDATLKDSIEFNINKTYTLLKNGDKSGLFENEFSYITDGKTFDEYLRYGEVSAAKVESLTVIDVLEIQQFDSDSLKAVVQVNFLGPSGRPTFIKDRITFYQQDGRWIKPLVGKLFHQLDYLKRMRQADSAASAEG
jgi:hypothetical protein